MAKDLLPIGARVLIDIFWTYTNSGRPRPTHPGAILDVTKNQYYVSLDGGSPQYVWHDSVIPEQPQAGLIRYILVDPNDDSGNDDGILDMEDMTPQEADRRNNTRRKDRDDRRWIKARPGEKPTL